MAGLAAARARCRNGGRPSKLSADQVRAARRLYDEREHTVEQIGNMFGVSRTSIPGVARQAGPGDAGCWWGSGASSPAVGSRQEVGVVTGPGKRLVTVLVTVSVPAEADAEDAAGLVADAAVSTALEVVSAAGVEGHLPVPGSLVVRRNRGQPWRVEAVSKDLRRWMCKSSSVPPAVIAARRPSAPRVGGMTGPN
jgi:hypothetical protein